MLHIAFNAFVLLLIILKECVCMYEFMIFHSTQCESEFKYFCLTEWHTGIVLWYSTTAMTIITTTKNEKKKKILKTTYRVTKLQQLQRQEQH